jgi:RecB family exonuclease
MLRLSQRHLKILETCPRQFEHIYLDRSTPIQESRTQFGSDFHMLMQQRELGLPIEPILERSPELKRWIEAILTTTPELFAPDSTAWRESEHVRTLAVDNYLFTAIYDLVILKSDQAEIIDWKTYPLPKYKKDLSSEWQTRLYLYMLAETSDYLPKQINFTYWFIKSSPHPKSVRIDYTNKQHRQTDQDLRTLLSKLTNWLEDSQAQREQFPQVAASTGSCQKCNFAPRCRREEKDLLSLPTLTIGDLGQIPVVAI